MPTKMDAEQEQLLNQMCRDYYIGVVNSIKKHDNREVAITKNVGDVDSRAIIINRYGDRVVVYTNAVHITIPVDNFTARASSTDDSIFYVEDAFADSFYITVDVNKDDVEVWNVGKD